MSWSDFDFIDSPVVVWSVITEPGQTTTQVLLVTCAHIQMHVHTHTHTQITLVHTHCVIISCVFRLFSEGEDSRSWIITHVNFTSIFLRTCEPLDYYDWTVSDGVSD